MITLKNSKVCRYWFCYKLFSTDDSTDADLNCIGIHEVISHFNTQITGSRTRTSGFQIFPELWLLGFVLLFFKKNKIDSARL